jgi:hypothetical protein
VRRHGPAGPLGTHATNEQSLVSPSFAREAAPLRPAAQGRAAVSAAEQHVEARGAVSGPGPLCRRRACRRARQLACRRVRAGPVWRGGQKRPQKKLLHALAQVPLVRERGAQFPEARVAGVQAVPSAVHESEHGAFLRRVQPGAICGARIVGFLSTLGRDESGAWFERVQQHEQVNPVRLRRGKYMRLRRHPLSVVQLPQPAELGARDRVAAANGVVARAAEPEDAGRESCGR